MTNKEILEKAIQKALEGGWNSGAMVEFDARNPNRDGIYFSGWYSDLVRNKEHGNMPADAVFVPRTDNLEVSKLIFDHDFAKALWGSDQDAAGFGYRHNIGEPDEEVFDFAMKAPKWKIKLALMAIADDPIDFLRDNI